MRSVFLVNPRRSVRRTSSTGKEGEKSDEQANLSSRRSQTLVCSLEIMLKHPVSSLSHLKPALAAETATGGH